MLTFLDSQLDRQKEKRLIVIGYSWGACLASYTLKQLNKSDSSASSSSPSSLSSVHAWIGVSFPLGTMSNFILKSQQLFDKVLSSSSNTIPRLLVMGDVDQFISSEETVVGLVEKSGGRRLLEDDGVGTEVVNSSSGELSIRVFRGNDHFWGQDCNRMVCYVLDWGVLRCEGK